MTSPSTTPPAPRALAGPLACLVAGLLAVATLVVVPVVPAAGANDRADRWAGYRIPSTGRAAGGWIGGYRLGRTPVFVITPERRPNRAGFRRADPTNDLAGRRGPSRRETQRAAWILSKYGGYREARQAAAVDAAVLHLLGDREWRLGGARGAARVGASGDPATVRRYVRLMLRDSRASAGRHRVAVVPATADVGGVTAVTVRVTDGHGGPVAGLPVTVTSPDGGTSEPAAGPVAAVTGDDGRAVVRLAAPVAGWRTVVARVGQVPEHRLRVRGADRRGQAAVAEGGVRRVVVASARVAVRGTQTLSIAADPGQLVVGSPARVVATVGGDGSNRMAIASLHGPFSSDGGAHCSPAPTAEVSAMVTADGAYAMPAVAPAGGGYFAWRVVVSGTDASTPVASCGAVVKVRAKSAATLDWAPAVPAAKGNVTATATVSGIPFPAPVDVRITLYQDGGCGSSIDVDEVRRFGNGAISSTFYVPAAGTYSWRAEVVPGELWVGTPPPCLPMTVS
ncbi:hypothetical protein EXE59_05185 [Nocardioides eburneiflavus]|uniref:Big-1 domain-containing protein n=1 Tax=Nocardioides eburneiflavus TaxID=2518372 RepID=A0A4Z1CDV0_9ACTN|nr:hypothetical protein [Nocardioides eburneiflavus]TGN63408.1 hypothetical protein EXE59_05185 [Nocardioides eburneiflavus]